MSETIIRWATHTLNFYTWNCNKVSPGCANCYAATLAERRRGKYSAGGQFAGKPEMRQTAWKELKRLPKGSVAFINSMSDTFHERVPASYIHAIFNAATYMRPDITFLVLTKRIERAYAMRHLLSWPRNLWLGTSIESADYEWRAAYLTRIPAAGRFVSAEPLLGAVNLKPYMGASQLYPINWVIVGAESGANRRMFDPNWARFLRAQCAKTGTTFMYKQGSHFMSKRERVLDGRTWDDMPNFNQYEVTA